MEYSDYDDDYTDDCDDVDEYVMNQFYGQVPAPTEFPSTMNGVCTLVKSGPVFDRFCGKNIPVENGYPCLVYSCPGDQVINGQFNPEWKTHSDVLKKYFNDNIKCPYDTHVGPVGPPYQGVNHLRGFCAQKVTMDPNAP
jgi:hypothetical protein